MGIAGPLGLKAIATIAGKALVISKVALTIAGIIALKKIFSKDHHGEKSFHVHADDVSVASSGGGGPSGSGINRRNMYIVRPVKSVMMMPHGSGGSGSMMSSAGAAPIGTTANDPYGYYNSHYDRM